MRIPSLAQSNLNCSNGWLIKKLVQISLSKMEQSNSNQQNYLRSLPIFFIKFAYDNFTLSRVTISNCANNILPYLLVLLVLYLLPHSKILSQMKHVTPKRLTALSKCTSIHFL